MRLRPKHGRATTQPGITNHHQSIPTQLPGSATSTSLQTFKRLGLPLGENSDDRDALGFNLLENKDPLDL